MRQSKIKRGALILGLEGELGSGKTTFVQGFIRGLGIKKRTVSPTFIIFRRLAIKRGKFKNLYHVDAYRIKNPKELLRIGFRDVLDSPENIVVIEWADIIKKILPKNIYHLRFTHGADSTKRSIKGSF